MLLPNFFVFTPNDYKLICYSIIGKSIQRGIKIHNKIVKPSVSTAKCYDAIHLTKVIPFHGNTHTKGWKQRGFKLCYFISRVLNSSRNGAGSYHNKTETSGASQVKVVGRRQKAEAGKEWGENHDIRCYPRHYCTLNNCTPITANMNWRRQVTSTMLPIVLTATITHWTTC